MIPNLDTLAAYGRRFQTARCVITHVEQGAFDPDTGTHSDPAETVVYDGSCLVQPTGGDRVVQFGERATSLRSYEIVVNGAAPGVRIGDEVTVSGSGDPALNESSSLVVIDTPKTTTLTNRKLLVEEVMD